MDNTWSNFQKEIPDDHYFYVRSCIRQTFFPGSETTLLKILRHQLGKDIYEHPQHTTCTGIAYHSDIVPLETTMSIIARHFALATEHGYENFLVSCVTSFGLYNEVIDTWHHFPETLEKTRNILYKSTGRTFEIPKHVIHASDIVYKFRDKISEKAKYSLVNTKGQPLRIVDHIGCHYAKLFPGKGLGGAEFPVVISGLVEHWGGQPVDYPERRHCCGFGFRHYLIRENRGYSFSNSLKKFESMAPYQPDAIVCNCPGCAMFLDKWQYTAEQMQNRRFGANNNTIPVLTYEELAGLVLGYNPWELGLQMHQCPAEPLLDKIGIAYKSEDKYRNKEGKLIGTPVLREDYV